MLLRASMRALSPGLPDREKSSSSRFQQALASMDFEVNAVPLSTSIHAASLPR